MKSLPAEAPARPKIKLSALRTDDPVWAVLVAIAKADLVFRNAHAAMQDAMRTWQQNQCHDNVLRLRRASDVLCEANWQREALLAEVEL